MLYGIPRMFWLLGVWQFILQHSFIGKTEKADMVQFTQTSQKSGVQPRVWCTHNVKLSLRDSLWRILAISHINRSVVLASCAKIQLNVFIIFSSKNPYCDGWSIRRPLFCILTQERKGLFDTVYFGEIFMWKAYRSKNWNENELALFANKQFVNE